MFILLEEESRDERDVCVERTCDAVSLGVEAVAAGHAAAAHQDEDDRGHDETEGYQAPEQGRVALLQDLLKEVVQD